MNKKKLGIFIVLLILVTSISLSYAYWQFNKTQKDFNAAGTNCFSLTYTDNTDSLILDNIVPTEDEEGLKEKGYSFTIKNTCNTIATYEVNLEDILSSSDIKHMPNKYIKVSLNDSTPKVLNTYEEVKTTISNATSSFKLTSGSLKPDEEATYELKLWMDSETPAIDEVMNATFESKITVNTSYIEEENLANDITIIATSQNEGYSKEKETFMIDITSTNKNIIEYSFNNQNWTSVTPSKEVEFNYDFTEEKNYTLYVKDEIGNVKTIEIIPDKLDQTSPEINIETTNNQESYTLTISLKDEKSGVDSYQITTSKEEPDSWLTYKDTLEKEIPENNTYYVWSKDKVGNISYKTIVVDKIDKTSPTITLSNTLTEWGIKDIIKIHLTDDVSGLAGYQIMTSQKEPTDYISLDNRLEEDLTYEVTENGTYYIYAKDAYGHISYKEITIDKIDKQSPSQNFDIESSVLGENNWYQSLTVKVTLTDNQSGVSSGKYCVTTEESCTPDKEATINNNEFTVFLGTNSLSQKVCVNSTDKVGNVSNTTCSESYFVDGIKPNAKINATVSGTNITVSAKGSDDEGSGIATYYYSKDGGTTYVTSKTASYTFTNLDKGTYHLALKVEDEAGNLSETEELEQSTIYPERATTFISNLVSGADSSSTDVYTVPGKTSDTCDYTLAYDGTSDNNLRYVGANPCNYVTFNGETAGWRIIGILNTPEGQRVKLIHESSIGFYSWDNTSNSTNSYGLNNWTASSLKDILNSGVYYNRESGNCPYGPNGTTIACDFTNNGLTSDSKRQIDTVTWNLGGTSAYNSASNGLVSHWYSYERSSNTFSGNATVWTGKVGLIYPSDYGYATSGGNSSSRSSCLKNALYTWSSNTSTSDCFNNNWIYESNLNQWTLTSRIDHDYYAIRVTSDGFVDSHYVSNHYGVRPTVYLKVKNLIVNGEGTKEEPYEIQLEDEYNRDLSECGGTADCVLSNASKSDEIATDDPDGNARYVGENPNNYVYIDNEYWRIIGSFKNIDDGTGTKETRLKLIRDESIGEFSWDTSDSTVNSGYGVNEWSQSDIMKLLNPGYLTESVGGSLYYYSESGNCYNGTSNTSSSCDFTKVGLKNDLKNLIGDAIWNTGNIGNDGWSTSEKGLSNHFYNAERSNVIEKICTTGSYCNDTVERITTWQGKIGLLYPSDYGYATFSSNTNNRKQCLSLELYNWNKSENYICKSNDWIYNKTDWKWCMTAIQSTSNSYGVSHIGAGGSIGSFYAYANGSINPVVYLKSSVQIVSGTGSKTDPYILKDKNDYNEDMKSCGGTADCVLSNASKSDEIATDDPDGNARYIGENPNNYVYIDNEYWRIIGSFKNIDDGTGKKATRLKLIRDESIGSYSWDTSLSSINNGQGVNEWSQADLMKLLNPGYENEAIGGSLYYNSKSGNCYRGLNNATAACDFTNNGLKENLKLLIGNALWNTGSNGTNKYITSSLSLPSKLYEYERSNNTGKLCTTGTYCNDTVERTTIWQGQIGLMYPSDYGYATSGGNGTTRTQCLETDLFTWNNTNTCQTNDWLYKQTRQFTLTPHYATDMSYAVFTIVKSGIIYSGNASDYDAVWPVVYLKSSVKLSSGIGSKDDPYILSES